MPQEALPPLPSPQDPSTAAEDALVSFTAGVITLAQTPRALSAAAAPSALAAPLPAAEGPRPIGGPAARFQIWGGQFRLRALTELTKAARGTAGRGKHRDMGQSLTISGLSPKSL